MRAKLAADYTHRNARDQKYHAVFAQHAKADRRAHREPPARVVRAAKTGHEKRHRHPSQVIERDILHERPRRNHHWRHGASREKLGPASAAELARHLSSEHDRPCARERSKKSKAAQRRPKQMERQPSEKWCDRWISDIAPGQMTSVIQCRQLIAIG